MIAAHGANFDDTVGGLHHNLGRSAGRITRTYHYFRSIFQGDRLGAVVFIEKEAAADIFIECKLNCCVSKLATQS
jgi:hypothetical protein